MRITLLCIICFGSFLTFAQNKKDQIEQLNFSLDSLKLILNEERAANLLSIQSLNNSIEALNTEKVKLEKQLLIKEKEYISENQVLDNQLKICKNQLDSMKTLYQQPNEDAESWLYYLKNEYLTNYIKGELNTPDIKTQNIGTKSFIITHGHDAGTHIAEYWEVQKTTLYPKYNIEYGSGDWDSELSYTFLNYDTKHEESGIIKGNNSDYLVQEIEKKIAKFIISGK